MTFTVAETHVQDFSKLFNTRHVCSDGKARSRAHYGEGTGNIWLDDVGCSGFENSILNCTHKRIGAHNCDHGEDAGVECKSVLIN